MENTRQTNLGELMGLMDKVNDTFSYTVWIPSLGRDVLFREIKTSQQKRLVKAVVDSPVFNTEFIFALRGIMKENCVDPTVDIDQLTIQDKILIALTMRAVSIGNDLQITMKCQSCGKPHTLALKVSDMIEQLKGIPTIEPKVIQDEGNVFGIYCQLPTISTEYKLEDEFRKNTKIEIESANDMRETVGNVFMSEVVKYIQKIEITDATTSKKTEIDMDNLSFANRWKIVEKISAKLLKGVIQYIADSKTKFDSVMLAKIICDCAGNPEVSRRFSIDSNFFIGS